MNTQKRVIRTQLKSRIADATEEYVACSQQKIIATLKNYADWAVYQYIHCYLPIPHSREISTRPFLETLFEEQVNVYVPLTDYGEVCAAKISKDTRYQPGRYHIPQPLNAWPVDLTYDVIVLPMIGFDGGCNRIGSGSGYYDRLLALNPGALKIGLAYMVTKYDGILPTEPHDQPLDIIITEDAVEERKRKYAKNT
jgi:5-formyltetrahydrofolate cyclo-ligase